MRNFTILFFLVFLAIKSHGQCTGSYSLNFTPVASDNSGFEQQLSAYVYTNGDYATIGNLLVGEDYVFTCQLGSGEGAAQKYVTVTDLNNVEIGHGESPFTVSSINATSVRVHYSDNATCGGTASNHITSIRMVLSCPFPVNLALSGITQTSTTFGWEPGASETSWEVIALPAASPAPAADLTEGVTTVNDNPEYTATLLAGTSYKFYYRSVCGATDKSPWASSAIFTTLCDEVTYFSQGFDLGTTLPNCYIKVGTTGSVYVQNQSTAASLPNNLYMDTGGVLALPSVSNFDAGTNRIKFKIRGAYGAGGSVEFGFLGEPSDATSFVALESFVATSTTVYNEYVFEPQDAIETPYLAFRHNVTDLNGIVLDDIIWEAIPACEDVTALTTTAFTSTTAALSWTSADTSFEVVYGEAATSSDPGSLTPQTVQENAIALSNLAPNTAYKVWVRSNCAPDAVGAWIGPRTVTTTCAPVTTFSENFNASSSIPACFKRVGNGGNAYIQSSALNISSYEDGNAGNVMSYGMVSLPAISNAAAGTHRLKFTLRASSTVGGTVELGYMENPENPASFTVVQSFTATASTPQTIIYIPAAGAITAEVLAFRHTGNPSYAVLIDDLIWETAPNCGDVTAIVKSEISSASAKISWTPSTETAWEVAYGATTVTDPNTLEPITVTDAANTVLDNLTAATTYKVWVRSNCGTSGFGAWAGPIEFTTSCVEVTDFSQNFDGSAAFPTCWTLFGGFMQTGSGASAPNSIYMGYFNVLATVPVSNANAGTHRLRFKAKANYSLGGNLQVGYLTNATDKDSFVALQTFTPTSITTFDEFYANLGTVPTTGNLALRNADPNYNAVTVDDIVWEVLPACEDVSGLTTGIITNNSAAVSWTAVSSTAWEVVYADASDTTPVTELNAVAVTGEANYTFVELEPNSAYKFWVRATCENGESGSWIGPKAFRTTCDAHDDLPWAEDFESVDYPNLPTCWTKGDGNWQVIDQTGSITTPHTGAQYVKIYNGAVNSDLWTVGFALEANTTYDFSTFVQGDGYEGWSVAMLYNITPSKVGATQMGELYEVPAGTGLQPHVEMKRTFTPTVSGTYFFAVLVNEDAVGTPFWLAFDDFNLAAGDLSNPGFNTEAFKVYPNPVKDILNLSYAENMTNVEVYNLLGQKVMAKAINASTSQLDMAALAAGSYLVKVTANNQVKTIKVIKQ